MLDSIPDLHDRRVKLFNIRPKPNSQLAVDNAATHPTELSHMVTYWQNMAIDNLRSLRLLLNPSKEAGIFLPQVAMFPMIRSVIESSAQSVWLLQPAESRERIVRTLRARKSEVNYERDLNNMMHGDDLSDPPETKKAKARARQRAARSAKAWNADLREIAKQMGITSEDYELAMPGYGPLIAEAANATIMSPRFARSVWQMVSGLTHPSSARGVSFSRIEELDGSTHELRVTRMTADPQIVKGGLTVALTFYTEAEKLLGMRLITPSGKHT